MYKRILLATDGSRETLVALREGALIAQKFDARAHLLIIDRAEVGWITPDGVSLLHRPNDGAQWLEIGLERLARLGVKATGEVGQGDPSQLIPQTAKRIKADLVIIGHRRQTFLERWWSGSSKDFIVDKVHCSVMIARESISDAEFETYLQGTP